MANGDVYVMNPDGSNPTLLYDGNPNPTFDPNNPQPVNVAQDGVDWSPDGSKILFSINSGFGTSQLYTIPAGGGPPTQLPGDGYQNSLVSWGVAFIRRLCRFIAAALGGVWASARAHSGHG